MCVKKRLVGQGQVDPRCVAKASGLKAWHELSRDVSDHPVKLSVTELSPHHSRSESMDLVACFGLAARYPQT